MSISPKLANSTPHDRDGGRWAAQHERLRHQPEVLKRLIGRYPYQLKFVINAPGDLTEVRAIVDEIKASNDRVLLMPEGVDPAVLQERARWLVDVCKREGFRFSPRLHIELWGNRRGV
jgi:7-carboxy-7-deazaguanine synthase